MKKLISILFISAMPFVNGIAENNNFPNALPTSPSEIYLEDSINEQAENIEIQSEFVQENVQKTNDDLAIEGNKQKMPFWNIIVFLVLIAGLIYTYVESIKNKKDTDNRIKALEDVNAKIENSLKDLNAFCEGLNRTDKSLLDSVQELRRKIQNFENLKSTKPNNPVENIPQDKGQKQLNNTARSTTKSSPSHIVKYGDFASVDGGDLLTIENRDLSDNPNDGWFVFELMPDGTTANYTINTSKANEMLEDTLQLQQFTAPFVSNNVPSAITVIKRGTVKKEGRIWTVTEKMVVEVK